MIGPGEVMVAIIVVGLPVAMLMILVQPLFPVARKEARDRGRDGGGESGAICRAHPRA